MYFDILSMKQEISFVEVEAILYMPVDIVHFLKNQWKTIPKNQ